jgi:exonuclease SbcC
MKLKAVHLQPWAGQANRNISFAPGLNVVLGVNDIGKSSLFAAIERALFLPAKLTKPIFAKELQPFVPIGGDTAKVSLEMQDSSGDAGITLEKTWGSRPDAVLKFPGGREVREEEAIREALEKLIGVRAGTYRSIHLARQSHLARSLEELKTDRSPIEDLGSILQKALFETDGVSVEGLRSRLNQAVDDHLSQWDLIARSPKDNRGLHNPWKRDVGTLLAAFYKKAQAEKDFEETRKAEAELDRLQQEL